MSIEIENVNKQFGTFKALSNVSLAIPSGELVALLGPFRVRQNHSVEDCCRIGTC